MRPGAYALLPLLLWAGRSAVGQSLTDFRSFEVTAAPAKATVSEVSYYGAHVVVRLVLPDGGVLTARGPSASTPAIDDVVGVSIVGPVVGHPGREPGGAR